MRSIRNVRGGTPLGTESMCTTCRCAQIIKGVAESDERVICRVYGSGAIVLHNKIVQCSSYEDKRQPTKWDMEQIAWTLVTNSAGKVVGFVSAEEVQRRKQDGQPKAA